MTSRQYRDRQGAVNSTDGFPIAYLVTFRCYGTWLHGDERGSVDRFHNAPDTPLLSPNDTRRQIAAQQLQSEPTLLSTCQRNLVMRTLLEVSDHRGWQVHAINVRTNHVHVVVSAACRPELVMNAWKSWSTRRLREALLVGSSAKVWSRHGSTRYLWTAESVANACQYTNDMQDGAE